MDSSAPLSLSVNTDPSLPAIYWNQLTQEDQIEFIKLRNHLHQNQKPANTVKDGRLISFSNEMASILKFIEHDEAGREQRSILTGVAFAGQFICVNTRQLKNFLGRCKSSINGSLQQLGYVAVKTKSKARSCVLAVMPLLASDANLLRQWTVRGASEEAIFCFVSKFRPNPIPVITSEDLNEDRKVVATLKDSNSTIKGSNIKTAKLHIPKNSNKNLSQNCLLTSNSNHSKILNSSNYQTPQQKIQNLIRHVLFNAPQQKFNILNNNNNNSSNDINSSVPVTEFKSPDIFNYGFNSDIKPLDMTPSFSVDYLNKFGDGLDNDYENDILNDYENEWNIQSHRTVPRSHSAFFSTSCDWKLFDDSQLFL